MSIAPTRHTVNAFDADLQELNRMIAEMGGLAERQLPQAVDALLKRDRSRAASVMMNDSLLDSQQSAIEQRAIAIIATRQPMAIDLREIVAVMRIAGELERIGDLAKNISKCVVALNGGKVPQQPLRGVLHMTSLAGELLKNVLDSYGERDSKKAVNVWNGDEEIDVLYISLFRELLSHMMEDPELIIPAVHLLFCAKNIERIGDRATNIAESVYFIVEGRTLEGERPKVDSTGGIAFTSHAPSLAPTA
jgi:phosphate transport system protein